MADTLPPNRDTLSPNHDTLPPNRDTLPSNRQLLKATAAAIVIAGVILVVAVLPAEYGIDPTGIGGRLGLNSLSAASPSASANAEPALPVSDEAVAGVPSVLQAIWKSPVSYRSDQLSLVLQPGEGAEIKAVMKAGERFVFNWNAVGGAVNFDMHGEKLNAGSDEFTSYWKGRNQTQGQGAFVAPFDGTHGWYWRNRGAAPVTISVNTSGFYDKLYRP